ncbi:hypothetical protein KCU91_g4696, partial [Aureobasidium melanogenum]
MITSIPLLTLLFLLMSAPALVRATCNNFTLEGEPYTLPGPTLYIISSGVVCKGKQNCTILAGGFITANRLLNNSSPDDSVNNDLFALIASASNISFEKSVSDNISTVTQTFEHGTAGYVHFRPDFRCVNGIFSGCPAGSAHLPAGEVAVQACTPDARNNNDHISGTMSKVLSDEATAKDLGCNPANVSSAADAPNKACDKHSKFYASDADHSATIGITTVALALFGCFGALLI